MKKIVLIFTLLIGFNVFSQPDPDIFQTWYLTFILSSDGGTPYTVSEINPQISPNLTISENYSFNGQGACNTFLGTFAFPGTDYDFEIVNFEPTTLNCEISIHNSFESEYFGFIQGPGWYEIEQDGTGLELTLTNPIFGWATFKNYPLSSTDFKSENIKIYPNPVKSELFIEHMSEIQNVKIISSNGVIIKVLKPKHNKIDLSDLRSGIYFLKVITDKGIEHKKLIKN